ncbi:uncharacterized protein EAE97_006339 [Botrytis byssoidea]|uniref:Uncharacterized protein n=1 Tax=Botrytis byssoidea TaxID=139641 RepID=A0A9P5IJ05_9HELO|nr:uncharacterized protein EAE97_006339 [Botrytis byssoidea]KAF7942885.1 hypothetical protein EAE97_006339 [Botrytis byssoidea]
MDIEFSPLKTLYTSEEDLTIFIKSELCSFRTKFTDDIKEYILKAVKENAVQGLRLPSRKDIKEKMKQLPIEINDLYKSLLQKVLINIINPNPFLIHQTLYDFLKSSGILKKIEILNQFEQLEMLFANIYIFYLDFEDIIEFSLLTIEDEDSIENKEHFLSYTANF